MKPRSKEGLWDFIAGAGARGTWVPAVQLTSSDVPHLGQQAGSRRKGEAEAQLWGFEIW